jgi:hypothetical protein
MIRKLLMFAITSGLAAKLYRSYAGQKRTGGLQAGPGSSRRSSRP